MIFYSASLTLQLDEKYKLTKQIRKNCFKATSFNTVYLHL